MITQPELSFARARVADPNVATLINLLEGHDWRTAAELLTALGRPVNESGKRWLRELAHSSEGEIASGQKGYKLVRQMTHDEYNHFRNWMKAQADQMTGRILRSDKIFYSRQPGLKPSTGILETNQS